MLLTDLVATSAAVAGASGRLLKIEQLAGLLGRVPADELETAGHRLRRRFRPSRKPLRIMRMATCVSVRSCC